MPEEPGASEPRKEGLLDAWPAIRSLFEKGASALAGSAKGPIPLSLSVLIICSASPLCAQGDAQPVFTLSYGPCPAEIRIPPGTTFRRTFDVLLTTDQNPTEVGAQGWSVSLSADNLTIVEITTRGTVAALVTDDPPGLREANGFHVVHLAQRNHGDCEGRLGAISAVVLDTFSEKLLPPSGR